MDKLLNYNVRSGIHVNMVDELEKIEAAYKADLKADFEVYDSIDEIENEMLSDKAKYCAMIDLYNHLGYIDDEECAALLDALEALRHEVYKNLIEKENNENGKEN